MEIKSFDDFDAFVASVDNVDCTMMLHNPEYHRWSVGSVHLDDLHLQWGELGSGNILEGQSWSDGYLLYLPLTDNCEYTANGTVIQKNSFMIFEPGSEFCLSSKGQHNWCTIFIPSHKLIEPLSGSQSMQGKIKVSQPNSQLAHQFQSLVRRVMNATANYEQIKSGTAATFAAAEGLEIASLILGQEQRNLSQPNVKPLGRIKYDRSEIIRLCHNFLEANCNKPFLVKELANGVEVSERTLRTVFKEYYGVGPARYLKLRQCHQVYRALRAADQGEVLIGDVMTQYGVWEFGRFAAFYRQMIGEYPLDTLKRKRN